MECLCLGSQCPLAKHMGRHTVRNTQGCAVGVSRCPGFLQRVNEVRRGALCGAWLTMLPRLARLGAVGRRKLILGVVGEGSLGLRLELGSRIAAKGGRVLRNLAADVVARTCLSETFLSESQASLGCTMNPVLRKTGQTQMWVVHAVIPTLRSWKPEAQELKALHSECEASRDYKRPCLKQKQTTEQRQFGVESFRMCIL